MFWFKFPFNSFSHLLHFFERILLSFIVVAGMYLIILGGSAKEDLAALIEANIGVVVTVELALALVRALRTDYSESLLQQESA